MKKITHRDFNKINDSIEIIVNGSDTIDEIKNEIYKFIRKINGERKAKGLPNYTYRIEAQNVNQMTVEWFRL